MADNTEISDDVKHSIIENRLPPESFNFPSKAYKDKRRKSGFMTRCCNRDWLTKYSFLCYSQLEDSVYCLACVLFPDLSHRRHQKLIYEPYRNWKDAIQDFKDHAVCEYHLSSMAKLVAFISTMENPSSRIDVNINERRSQTVARNRQILSSIIRCLEFCGRQGISLRGHRDDETCIGESKNMGNFKELLKMRAEAGDEILKEHLDTCAKNATYISKSSQNELLFCMKKIIQDKIIDDINKVICIENTLCT